MSHAERGGLPEIDRRTDTLQRGRGNGDLLGERTTDRGSHHAVPHRHVVHAGTERPHGAGELASRGERDGQVQLVLVRHKKDVGKIGRRGGDVHYHLTPNGLRVGEILDDQGLARPVLVTSEGAHRAQELPTRCSVQAANRSRAISRCAGKWAVGQSPGDAW